jgi:hypothetical protein
MSLLVEPARRHSERDHQAKPTKQRRKLTPAERKARRAKREARREAERARLAQYLNPNMVLTFYQWCVLNNFSEMTGRRILAGERGPPPVVTQLSSRRVGITNANNARWQESRARGGE